MKSLSTMVIAPFRFIAKWTLVRPFYSLRASNFVWTLLNKKGCDAYRQHPVTLSSIERRIVSDLERDGIAIAHIDELFPESSLLKEMQEETQRLLPSARMSDKKEFFLDLLDTHPVLDITNSFVKFSLSDKLVSISNAYLKMWSKFYRYRLTSTVVVPQGKEPRFSQCWHRDPEDKKLCKIFLYLNDVDETTGPFMYIAKSHHGGKWRGVYPQQTPYGNFPPDEVIDRVIPKEDVRVCTGRAGTIVFADTSGIHRGGFSTMKQRLMFIAAFSSRNSFGKRIGFDLPENKTVLDSLSEPTRFAIGLPSKRTLGSSSIKKIKKLLGNFALLFFVFILMSGIIEGGYRFMKKTQYAFPKGIFQEDSLVGYSLTPKFHGTINAPEYTTDFSVNSDGNRDIEHPLAKEKNTYRILGLGDSFSMGMGVEYEDMFWTQLENRANTSLASRVIPVQAGIQRVEVIKTGVGGYDSLEESLYLRERGMKYTPDLVVLEVYENDFSTKIKVSEGPHVVNGYLATSKSEHFSVRDFVFRHMRSWGYIAAKIRAIPIFAQKTGGDGTLHFEMDVTQRQFTNPETQKILDITFGYIKEMNETAKRGGAKFAVVAVPGSYRIDPIRREKLMQQYGLKPEETNFYKHYNLLEDLGKQKGFPVLNLGTILESSPKDPSLYYASDQHFTKTGSHIAGDAIEKFLRQQKLLP